MTSTTSAHLSVSGFLGFRAGELPRVEGAGEVVVPTGEEGSVIRFDAESGRDVMSRWVVVEPGHRYRVERVTRVTLLPGGGFSATAFDAHYVYYREDANRVDVATLGALQIEGKPYQVRHEHGGAAAKVSMAIFEVKNTGKTPRTLAAKKVAMLREYGGTDLSAGGVSISIAKDESQYSEGGEPAPSVTIPPNATVFVRVHVTTQDVYLASINSSFRWSVEFESGGKTVTATVPQQVMRMEPYRPRGNGE